MLNHPNDFSRQGFSAWNSLLFLPFIALLWVPFYNSIEPQIWGIPFFYWYQFIWIFITSGLTYIVHVKVE